MKDLWLLAALRIFGKNDRDIKRITAVMTSFFCLKWRKWKKWRTSKNTVRQFIFIHLNCDLWHDDRSLAQSHYQVIAMQMKLNY